MFAGIEANLHAVTLHPGYLIAACLLIFCGTIGKSAQMPLHVWLPNSMEGPTPVSSLLHAATMVAAGVYMLARIFPVLLAAPDVVRDVIMWIGAITCFAAGLMAIQQDDIKRILAYSTISQLGYMVVGIGVGATGDVAMFHLFTHAFFKCLLFLCAGSIIIALHHEQNIWKMGGLLTRMPVTAICMLAGGLALAAYRSSADRFSKDNIIEWAWLNNRPGFWITASAVLLTALYTFRLLLVVLLGKPRGDHAARAKESPLVMTLPLVILARSRRHRGLPVVHQPLLRYRLRRCPRHRAQNRPRLPRLRRRSRRVALPAWARPGSSPHPALGQPPLHRQFLQLARCPGAGRAGRVRFLVRPLDY